MMHPLRFHFVLSFLSVLIINHLTLAQAGFYPNSGSIVAKTNMQSRMNQFPLMHIVAQVPWNHQITQCLSTAHSYSYRMQNQQLFCASVCAANSMPVRAHLSNSTCGLTPQTPVKPHNQNDNANIFSFPCTLGGIIPCTSGGTVYYTNQDDLQSTNPAYQGFSSPLVGTSYEHSAEQPFLARELAELMKSNRKVRLPELKSS